MTDADAGARGLLHETVLPAEPTAPGVARRWLSSALAGMLGECGMDVLALLSTELVTNAVVHGGSPVQLRVWVGAAAVVVEVHDQAAPLPVLRHTGRDATSGRGMRLVEHLASRWGVRKTEVGKCVWFELTVPYDPAATKQPFDGDGDADGDAAVG